MILRRGFLFASFIYFFNSLANVSQGVLIKYYQTAISIGLYQMIALKCFVSLVIMFPFAFKYLRQWKKNVHIVLLLSFLYSLDLLCCNTGFKTVPVNTGTLILLLIPLWVVVLGRIILKEKKFNKVNAIALGVCLVAMFITIKNEISFNGFAVGYIFLFLASIIIPLGLILQKKFSDCRPVIYALFTNALVLGVISFALSGFDVPKINMQSLQAGLFVAICDLVEFAAVYIAYQMTEPALLQPIRYTRILISVALSYILLHEMPTKYQIIGAVLIIIANIFSLIYSNKKQS